jgi:hypothetical protein
MKPSTTQLLHWTPRILCILAILFISLFALDAFEPGRSLGQQFGAFFMHLIPTMVLTILLLIAWRWGMIGGIIFTIIGIVMSPIIYQHNYSMNNSVWVSLSIILTITIPFIIVGALFITESIVKERHKKTTSAALTGTH